MGIKRKIPAMLLAVSMLHGTAVPVFAVGPFQDVSPDSSYAEAISYAYDNGITTGTSASTFSPDRLVSSGEMAMMFCRAFFPDKEWTMEDAVAETMRRRDGVVLTPDLYLDSRVTRGWAYKTLLACAGIPAYGPELYDAGSDVDDRYLPQQTWASAIWRPTRGNISPGRRLPRCCTWWAQDRLIQSFRHPSWRSSILPSRMPIWFPAGNFCRKQRRSQRSSETNSKRKVDPLLLATRNSPFGTTKMENPPAGLPYMARRHCLWPMPAAWSMSLGTSFIIMSGHRRRWNSYMRKKQSRQRPFWGSTQ